MIYFYVLLLRIVAYLDGPPKFIAFIAVFSMISYSSLKQIPFESLNKITIHNFYVLVLVFAILLHGGFFGNILLKNIAVLITYWLWFVFTYNFFKGKTIDQCLKYILIAFFIFNFANYLHFKIYFADQKYGINSILSLFGVYGYRIYFPLSSGANIFTSQLTLNSLIVLHFIKTSKVKYIYVLMYAFYIMMLVIADSRLLLAFAFFFSIIYWFSFRTILAFFKRFWWAISILFFGFLFLFYGTNLFDAFKRAGELEGNALSRIKIWSIAQEIIFADYHIIFGYGLNGFENNMPEAYWKIFKNQYLQTSHNFIIQNIIDFGLFGIIIILYLIFEIIKITIKIKSTIVTILVIVLLFMGITESIPSFYSFEPTLFFITVLSILLTTDERKDTSPAESLDLLS